MKKNVTVANIRVDLDTNRVKIQYDVSGIISRDSVYVQIESRNRGLLNARTVTGDVGTAVEPGKNKTVYWDYRLDGLTMEDAIRVTVLVSQPVPLALPVTIGGGPANALLSAVAPGVGTIFVQPNRKIGIRPLITGAYVGIWVYGLVCRSQSDHHYELYTSQLNKVDYTEANRLHHHYLVASWTALALLLTDVTYTFLKGRNNEKQKQAARQQVAIRYVGNTPTVGVQLTF
ncbi:hypothetical protein ACAW75_10965 [Fibrella sp. Tmos10]